MIEMKKGIMALLVVAALSFSIIGAGSVQAQGENDQPNLTSLINKLDISISSLRKGSSDGASTLLSGASTIYENSFSPSVETKDNALNIRINQSFTSLAKNPAEENIFALRTDVLRAAGLVGVSLPPLYAYSLFIILGVGVMVSLFSTLMSKRLVNWDMVRKNKAEISKFQKELREAMRKKDAKEVHKIQQRQGEITKLQGEMFKQTLKPTIILTIPLLFVYFILINVYSGWVVAWLPFSIDLPFFGRLVAFGYGWWYILTSIGFSQIFRKIMIRD